MSTSMSVDSGHGSSSEELQPLFEAAGNQELKPVAGAPGFTSQQMVVGLFAQVLNISRIAENVQQLISSSAIWNKEQSKRIAGRFSAIAKRLESMVRVGNSVGVDKASDGGSSNVGLSELTDVLEKGRNLVVGPGDKSEGVTNIICRTNNPQAFAELHEELDAVVAKVGLQGMGDEFTSEMEKIRILNADAEVDKNEIPKILSQMPDMDHKVAKLVSERMEGLVEIKKLVQAGNSEALPSYLTIPMSELKRHVLIRPYERLSTRDPKKEVGWAWVYSGQWLGYKFAMKVFDCRAKENGDPAAWNQRQLLMEAGSLVELQHPHVTRLVGFGQDADSSVFVMEHMDKDLRQFIKASTKERKKPFEDNEALNVITQIAKGMYFIHTKGYTHGDLKCSNILVKNHNNRSLEVKIGDLRGSQKHGQWDSEAFEQASKTRRPRWTAPEFIDYDCQEEPSWESLKKLDIYSFGMTCYEIVTGEYPFHGIRQDDVLKQEIRRGEWLKLPETLDKDLKALITSCSDTNPEKRPPSFKVICQLLDNIKSKTQDRSWIAWMLNQFALAKLQNWVQPQRKEHLTESSGILDREDSKIPECLNIDPKQLQRGERIGLGSSASVFKTTWLRCTYAEKVLNAKNKSHIQEELNSLIKVSRHPCIAQLIGLSIKPDGECSILMEYIGGNLRDLIYTRMKKRKLANRTRAFDVHEEVRIISEIALGMAYLHSRGLVHRDLKPTNVLAQERSGIIDVKIVDFGISHLEDSLESSDTHAAHMGYYTGCGTPFYRAPEMIGIAHLENVEDWKLPRPQNLKPDLQALKATDVYSFAVTCYEVLTGYSSKSNLPVGEYSAKVISEGLRPTWPEDDSNSESKWLDLKALVERCWVSIPQERPTFNEICKKLQEIQNSN